MGFWSRCVVVLGLLAALVAFAGADTGGSMGGGSWGGGGHSSSSRSHSSSSSSGGGLPGGGGHPGGRRHTRQPSGSGDGMSIEVMVVLAIAFVIIWGVGAAIDASKRSLPSLTLGDVLEPTVDVTVLRIALDGRARKFVQTELARIAKVTNTATAAGRHAMLAEVTLLLRRVRDAWIYGGAVNEPMRGLGGAKVAFDAHVLEARAKFHTETVRNHQGQITTAAAPDSTPRSFEGAGLILVTLVVAANGELFTVRHIGDGEDLRKALEAATYRSERDLVAIEIVWQPSDDADRLSSMELEAKYPPPSLIPLTGALVARRSARTAAGRSPPSWSAVPTAAPPPVAMRAPRSTTRGCAPWSSRSSASPPSRSPRHRGCPSRR